MKKQSKTSIIIALSFIFSMFIACEPEVNDSPIDSIYPYYYKNMTNEVLIVKFYNNPTFSNYTGIDSVIITPNSCSKEMHYLKVGRNVEILSIDSIDVISYKKELLLKRYKRYNHISKPIIDKTPFDISDFRDNSSIASCGSSGQVYLLLEEDLY